ncbi:hypothetical protein C1H46_006531 [Malus baccata]|uniref:BED-type domain-containing protein n=1 Tax=Malus baccata TaxID=106549 RepID=A0A540NA11_MALBA|nr:hypothetical protein C1H46_006531 [Malus baccata]
MMIGTSSSGASTAMSSSSQSENVLKRSSEDVGWEYGILANPTNTDKVKCKLCNKIISGGVHRLKQHVANIRGNVAACTQSSDEDKAKCRAALEGAKNKKKQRDKHNVEVREEVQLQQIQEEEDIEVIGSRKRPRTLGPMDRFASAINPDSSNEGSKNTRQQNINDAIWKERAHQVDQYVARWVYEAGIPFHAIDNDSFKRVMEAVGQFGPGYLPPSQYELREPLLKEEVERVKKSLKKHEEEWALNGCSIMTDAWSDRKRRSIMNLCVNCKEGTIFLSSKECSSEAHTGEYIFEYVDKCVEEIGPQNVIQVVTDNASNNMAAANMMKKKRRNMFWTSCATPTLNLMLQGIGNLPRFKGVIDKAKAFTIFIYAHHKTLALMRKHTKKRDIIRPGVTRFATSFLTLQSLMDKKKDLKVMVASEEWEQCKHVKTTKGKVAYATILSSHFWSGVLLCLKVFEPLFKLLRIVDGDKKPSMGFLYGELQKAKMEIKETFKNNEANYQPILQIIDEKARERLDSPLHLAGYLFNPYYFFKDQSIQHDPIVMEGIFTCVEKFFPDNYEVQNQVINVEMHKYRVKEGGFGRHLAELGCVENDETYNPGMNIHICLFYLLNLSLLLIFHY